VVWGAKGDASRQGILSKSSVSGWRRQTHLSSFSGWRRQWGVHLQTTINPAWLCFFYPSFLSKTPKRLPDVFSPFFHSFSAISTHVRPSPRFPNTCGGKTRGLFCTMLLLRGTYQFVKNTNRCG